MLDGIKPWSDSNKQRYYTAGYWRGKTLTDTLGDSRSRFGSKAAVIGGSNEISYNQLGKQIDRTALHLLDQGFQPDDRIIFQLPNIPEFVLAYYGALKVGIKPIMALPLHRRAEITHFASLSEATGYLAAGKVRNFDYQALGLEVASTVPNLRKLLIAGDEAVDPQAISFSRLLNDPIEERRSPEELERFKPNPEDVAVLLLSGGSTGMPKFIPRTHNDYEYNSRVTAELAGVDENTRYLAVSPVAHNFTLACPGIQGTLFNGGTVVLSQSVEPVDIFSAIENHKITHTSMVPALAQRLLQDPHIGEFDLSSLKLMLVGGQRLQPEPAKKIMESFGCTIQQSYGMGEGLINVNRLDDPSDQIIGTQGRPSSPADEIRIVNDEGMLVERGETGELQTRGPYTIRNYWRGGAVNDESFTPDGYYKTGDLVRQNELGNLTVEGRKKDLINRGGEKISAEGVEAEALKHPAIANIAVVAMPDRIMGEKACAYVMLKPGQVLDLKTLTDFMRAQGMAVVALPERLEIVDSFPLTTVGKVSKASLRDDIRQKIDNENQASA